MTASSSASWSTFSLPSNFDGHVSTMWFMVCCWPQLQEGNWTRPHLCQLARHGNGSSETMTREIKNLAGPMGQTDRRTKDWCNVLTTKCSQHNKFCYLKNKSLHLKVIKQCQSEACWNLDATKYPVNRQHYSMQLKRHSRKLNANVRIPTNCTLEWWSHTDQKDGVVSAGFCGLELIDIGLFLTKLLKE